MGGHRTAGRRRAPPCSSPPSTSRRPTAWPAAGRHRPRPGHRRGDAGVDEGRPRRHRARGRVCPPSRTHQRTGAILDALGPHTSWSTGTLVEVTVDNGPQAAMIALRALDAEGIVPHDVQPARAQPRRRVPVPHRAPHRGPRTGRGRRPRPDARRRRKRRTGRARGADARRDRESSHDHHRRRTRHRARAPHTPVRRAQHPLAGVGHRHPHPAQPARRHPDPRGAVLLHGPADHVRAAVPLRLRRGHPHRRHQLRQLPDARASSCRRWPSAR